MALGATAQTVSRILLAEASRLLTVGLAIGLVLASLGARLLRGLFYNITATDVRMSVITATVLVMARLLACWIPARRAARSDPAVVLRNE